MSDPDLSRAASSDPSPPATFGPAVEGTQEQLATLFAEVNALAIRLRQTAALRQSQGELPAGGQSVLRILARLGPRTVPQVARVRCTSRQNIQILVNALAADGCVEIRENPAHKRSPLVSLTDRGRDWLAKSLQRDTELLERLASKTSEAQLRASTALVRQLRQELGQPHSSPAAPSAQVPRGRSAREAKAELPDRQAPPRSDTDFPSPRSEEAQPAEGELPINLL